MTEDIQGLWSEMRGRLRAFIAQRVGSDAAVDDLLQEVFLRIHQKIDSVRDPRRLVSWIYQIARHVMIDYYRAPHRRHEVPAGLAADVEGKMTLVEPGEEPGELRTQLARCLRPMIERLAPDYREAMKLVELEGFTQQAAAAKLGLSLSGMKSRVQRGRRQLKAMLHDCCLVQLDSRRGIAEYALRDPAENPCAPFAPMLPAERRSR
ncbi:MAG: RNA polymerase sigma factor SigZ [Nitrospira sp.]|jgi:RNA polymerase sigma-70 factor (ECF subfamily)|nr:RNA polymerase sigma factor SigZ [Nitrospira sp.]